MNTQIQEAIRHWLSEQLEWTFVMVVSIKPWVSWKICLNPAGTLPILRHGMRNIRGFEVNGE